VGDRLDEQLWPLGLIRVWGHLGLAITYTERDGDLARAGFEVDAASELLEEVQIDMRGLASDQQLATRAPATVMECRGLILLREGKVDDAIEMLTGAVGRFPHSRSYIGLALALEQRAVRETDGRKEMIARALRLLGHAVSLGPTVEPSAEVGNAMDRLSRLDSSNGGLGA
jgi:hypothetical protein